MIDPTVRRAVAGDAAALGQLERRARDSLVDTRGGNRWLDQHAEVGDRWATVIDECAVFLATVPVDGAEVAVGYLAAELRTEAMLILWVDQVWIEPDARELGFGDALLAEALAWGRRSGAGLVEGEALPGDRNLKNLYERAAITARLITVSRPL